MDADALHHFFMWVLNLDWNSATRSFVSARRSAAICLPSMTLVSDIIKMKFRYT